MSQHDSVLTDAEILDLSHGGFRARTNGDLRVGDRIDVSWAGAATRKAIVTGKSRDGYGCIFEHWLGEGAVSSPAGASATVIPFTRAGQGGQFSAARWRFRQRLAAIVIGALGAWIGTIGLGWAAYTVL